MPVASAARSSRLFVVVGRLKVKTFLSTFRRGGFGFSVVFAIESDFRPRRGKIKKNLFKYCFTSTDVRPNRASTKMTNIEKLITVRKESKKPAQPQPAKFEREIREWLLEQGSENDVLSPCRIAQRLRVRQCYQA